MPVARPLLNTGMFAASLIAALPAFAGPQVRSLLPGSGPLEGGTDLLIRGSGFQKGAKVTIGGVPCRHAEVMSETEITCLTPKGGAGAQSVTVANPDGSKDSYPSAFRYEAVFSIGGVQAADIASQLSLRPKNAFYAPDYLIVGGGGSMESKTATFKTPEAPSSTLVFATDPLSGTAEALVTSYSHLSLIAEKTDFVVGHRAKFSHTGGVPPIRYSVIKGGGTIDESTGDFQAPNEPGDSIVQAMDAIGSKSEIPVKTVRFTMSPKLNATALRGRIELNTSGGFPPYTFSVVSGGGSVDESGVFTASDISGASLVRATDSRKNITEITLETNLPLEVLPAIRTLFTDETQKLYAEGGVPPYRFRLTAGKGRVNSETGLFVAPAEPTVATVEVSDAEGTARRSEISVLGDRISARHISGGSGHTCAFNAKDVRCWGDNLSGQLGDGSTKVSRTPSRVSLSERVSSIAAGGYHTCVIVNYGVRCWGDNTYGQLGQPRTLRHSSKPISVPGLERGVTAIAAGNFHTCALRNGRVLCWGRNEHEQLGIPTVPFSVQPVVAVRRGALALGLGASHSCALFGKGAACWGQNSSGQLGNGSSADSSVPVPVNDLRNEEVTMITGGSAHTCALVSGTVRCWGFNGVGSLGLPGEGNYGRPQLVEGLPPRIRMIVSGGHHSCALADGAAYCWGLNNLRQVAEVVSPRSPPAQVQNLPAGILELAAGTDHTCALYADSVRCWGADSHHQIGASQKRRLLLQ